MYAVRAAELLRLLFLSLISRSVCSLLAGSLCNFFNIHAEPENCLGGTDRYQSRAPATWPRMKTRNYKLRCGARAMHEAKAPELITFWYTERGKMLHLFRSCLVGGSLVSSSTESRERGERQNEASSISLFRMDCHRESWSKFTKTNELFRHSGESTRRNDIS